MEEGKDFTWLKEQIYDKALLIYRESVQRFVDLVSAKITSHAEDPHLFMNFPNYWDLYPYVCDTVDSYHNDFCNRVALAIEEYQGKNPELQSKAETQANSEQPEPVHETRDDQLTQKLNYIYAQKTFLQKEFFQYIDESLASDFDLEQAQASMPDLKEREYSQKSVYCALVQAVGGLFPDLIKKFENFLYKNTGPMDLQWAKSEVTGLNWLCNEILSAIIGNANDLLTGAKKDKPEVLFKNTFEKVVTEFFNTKVQKFTVN